MSRHKSHLIQEAAERLFKESIPNEWVARSQNPDYEIDFFVEVYDRGHRAGFTFAAQVKGTTCVKKRGDAIKFSIETKYLIEYGDRVKEPVFLFVVDVSARACYWLFMQRFIDEALIKQNWRSKKSVTISLPARNVLGPTCGLRVNVEDAVRYMMARHPIALETAIEAEVHRLQRMDPRITVSLQASNERRDYTLAAKEPIKGTLAIKGVPSIATTLLQNLIERGLPIDLEPGQLEMSGSPLLDYISKNARRFEAVHRAQGVVSLTALAHDGCELTRIEGIRCHLSGGTREWRGIAALAESILAIEFEFGEGAPVHPNIILRLRLTGWEGHRLLSLPYFDDVYAVVSSILTGGSLNLQCIVDARRVFPSPPEIHLPDKQMFEDVRPLLEFLAKARVVARNCRVDPVFESKISAELFHDVRTAYDMITRGEHIAPADGYKVTTHLNRNDVEELLLADDARSDKASLRLNADFRFNLFNTEVRIEPIEMALSRASLASSNGAIRRMLNRNRSSTIGIKWRGTANSELTYRKA